MKKLLFATFLALFFFPIAMKSAPDNATALSLQLRNGKETVFVLNSKPVVSYSGEDIIVRSSESDFSCPRSEVERITFTEVSGIVGVSSEKTVVSLSGRKLIVDGASTVVVSDMQGRCVAKGHSATGACIEADLSACPSGIYLISTDNCSQLKIILR